MPQSIGHLSIGREASHKNVHGKPSAAYWRALGTTIIHPFLCLVHIQICQGPCFCKRQPSGTSAKNSGNPSTLGVGQQIISHIDVQPHKVYIYHSTRVIQDTNADTSHRHSPCGPSLYSASVTSAPITGIPLPLPSQCLASPSH